MVAGLLEEFRTEVEKIFGEELVSLTVYGSHATDEPEGQGRRRLGPDRRPRAPEGGAFGLPEHRAPVRPPGIPPLRFLPKPS